MAGSKAQLSENAAKFLSDYSEADTLELPGKE